MADLKTQTPEDFFEQAQYERPIAGEALTRPPKRYPMERPPLYPDPAEALDKVFDMLATPTMTRQMLNMLDSGVPLDLLVASMLDNFVGEGATTPQAAITMSPALTTMVMRMAEAGKVQFRLSTDDRIDEIDPSELHAFDLRNAGKVDKAQRVSEISKDELSALPSTDKGLLSKPEELV